MTTTRGGQSRWERKDRLTVWGFIAALVVAIAGQTITATSASNASGEASKAQAAVARQQQLSDLNQGIRLPALVKFLGALDTWEGTEEQDLDHYLKGQGISDSATRYQALIDKMRETKVSVDLVISDTTLSQHAGNLIDHYSKENDALQAVFSSKQNVGTKDAVKERKSRIDALRGERMDFTRAIQQKLGLN